MTNREKQLDAANRLEDLAMDMKLLIPELREGMTSAAAYRKVYELRRELGRVVATLGCGVPTR